MLKSYKTSFFDSDPHKNLSAGGWVKTTKFNYFPLSNHFSIF